LKSTITQKDVKIRQLEAQLEQMNVGKWIFIGKRREKRFKI
jgi:hypothetical protein